MERNVFQDFLRKEGLTSVQASNLACVPYNTAKEVFAVPRRNHSVAARYRFTLLTGPGYFDLTPEEELQYQEQRKDSVLLYQAEEIAQWLIQQWRQHGALPEDNDALSKDSSSASQNMPSYLARMYPKVSKIDALHLVQEAIAHGGRVLTEADLRKIQESTAIFLQQLTILLSASPQELTRAKPLLKGNFSQIVSLLNVVVDPDPHAALKRQIEFQKIFSTNKL
ncbi:MAG: hypothetical protein WC004_04250 [Candidatus Absconditabacterales bacterium]